MDSEAGFYDKAVTSLTVTEPEEPMGRQLDRDAKEQDRPVEVVRASAENLPFEDGSFDCVVSTLVLCTVEDQPRALGEALQMLKPDGQLLFIEHVRSQEDRLARWQDRLKLVEPVCRQLRLQRPTLDGIQAAGFSIAAVTHGELTKAPPFARPLIVGTATPRAASSSEAQSPGESIA